jgi:heat-inducible transcriptional repressor
MTKQTSGSGHIEASDFGLSERAQHLLKVLVERYIRDGQPIGSRALTRDSGLGLSPATVRNVMADLEELGLLEAPHTSAGRVPTIRGYRVFIDSLLTVKDLSAIEADYIHRTLDAEENAEQVIQAASGMLSSLTHLAGIVTLPRQDALILRQVEFLPLSGRRILVILVVNEREVQNRILHVDRDYQEGELQRVANYLNQHFAGRPLEDIAKHLTRQLRAEEAELQTTFESVLELSGMAFEVVPRGVDYVLSGETNLIGNEDLADVRKLKEMFEALTRKREVLNLLEQCLAAAGTQIFIGDETGFQVLDECSIVTAPYTRNGRIVGVLGVIGPTRMAYHRVIPIVDMTARLVSSALNFR